MIERTETEALAESATTQLGTPNHDRAAVRDHLVALQWDRIELLGCFEENRAQRLFTTDPKTPLIRPLEHTGPMPDRVVQNLLHTPDQVRMRRLLDFVKPGDSILDIGCGYGYVSGVLLRDCELASYRGIDCMSHIAAGAEALVEENGLGRGRASFSKLDVLKLTRQFVAEQEPSLVLMLEMLEHVESPEQTLATAAKAVDEGTDILFSVPLPDRLESCWGHVSFFETDRLKRMCENAGLTVQWVESVHNRWIFVLASKGKHVSPRWQALAEGSAPYLKTEPRRHGHHAHQIQFDDTIENHRSHWTYRTKEVLLSRAGEGIRCDIVGSKSKDGGQYGGVCFHVPSFAALRIELTIHRPRDVRGIYVEGLDDANVSRVRWAWRLDPKRTPGETPITYVLHPGRSSAFFKSVSADEPDATTIVHCFMEVARKSQTGFTLHRVTAIV